MMDTSFTASPYFERILDNQITFATGRLSMQYGYLEIMA